MDNKELDEMREKIAKAQRCLRNCQKYPSLCRKYSKCKVATDTEDYEMADQILSLKTSNGYSIEEMIEFFGKIKRDTQREAVVKKKAELPKLSGTPLHPTEIKYHAGYYQNQQDMLAKHFEQEVKE